MKRWSWLIVVLLVLGLAGPAKAWNGWYALSVPEMAAHGATHMAIFSYSDFAAETTTNTALAVTNAISAKTSVECVGMLLDKAFDTANTNYTGSFALIVGDGSDTDLFLASTELASDGTEVFVKYPPTHTYSVSSTLQTNSWVSALAYSWRTNTFLTDTNGTTANVTSLVVTATTLSDTNVRSITASASAGELGRKLYSSAGNLVFTFTPNLNEALSANVQGQVRVYFKLQEFLK